MAPACPSLEALQAAAESRTAPSSILDHIRGCSSCLETTEALAGLSPILSELARAAGGDSAPDIWTGVAGRLEHPGLIERLPLRVAGSARVAMEFARPAVATAVAVGLAGLAAGAWLGLTSQRPVDASASDPFGVSSLVDDPGDGLASTYALSFASAERGSEAGDPVIPGGAESLEQDSTMEAVPK